MPDHDADFLRRDIAEMAAGRLARSVLVATPLDRGLHLTVSLEAARGEGALCWAVAVTGNEALASRLHLGSAGLVQAQHVLGLALDRAASSPPPRGAGTVVLAAAGDATVGVGLAGDVVWAVLVIADRALTLPASNLRMLRTALAVAEQRVSAAFGTPVQ